MSWMGWIQLVVFVLLLTALTKPLGLYLVHVFDPGARTFLDPVFKPVERLMYRILGVRPEIEQDWKSYAVSLLVFSFVGLLFTYGILRLQRWLPFNPQGFAAVSPDMAFNTSASFMTNTNWQNYAGERTLSYFSQMVALTFHNFASAAVGGGVAAVLVRGIARDKTTGIGNFWVDITRQCLYLYLPIGLVLAVFLVSQGVIQNFSPYTMAKTMDSPAVQTIAQGPVASQVAIKMLGTNGGGFMNANAAHPFENPTPLSNFIQMLAIFAIPSGLTYFLGRMVKNQKHGWTVWSAMFLLFLAGALFCWWAEARGNPHITQLGVDAVSGNMEGKEVRFGIFNSALFATITTDASCGAVNAMHDSFTPLGGLVLLLNMQLGEVVFGGVGAGLYGMLVFVVLAIFLAGLMIGRTPEYLGKKIEAFEVKAAALAVLIPAVLLLGFTAWAAVRPLDAAGLNNSGPHGFSEMLYAFTSAVNNNGSAFAGLSANTPWYNTALGLVMLCGRFFVIIPVLGLAGSLGRKKIVPPSAGSFPAYGPTFALLLIGTIFLVGALTFLPALSLGPVVEHFLMMHSPKLF